MLPVDLSTRQPILKVQHISIFHIQNNVLGTNSVQIIGFYSVNLGDSKCIYIQLPPTGYYTTLFLSVQVKGDNSPSTMTKNSLEVCLISLLKDKILYYVL